MRNLYFLYIREAAPTRLLTAQPLSNTGNAKVE